MGCRGCCEPGRTPSQDQACKAPGLSHTLHVGAVYGRAYAPGRPSAQASEMDDADADLLVADLIHHPVAIFDPIRLERGDQLCTPRVIDFRGQHGRLMQESEVIAGIFVIADQRKKLSESRDTRMQNCMTLVI